jgi:hypothetical protein
MDKINSLLVLCHDEQIDIRKPHALQSVLAPSGPRRHSGVSLELHELHCSLGLSRCLLPVIDDNVG